MPSPIRNQVALLAILKHLKERGPQGSREVAEALGLKKSSTARYLEILRLEKGAIVREEQRSIVNQPIWLYRINDGKRTDF